MLWGWWDLLITVPYVLILGTGLCGAFVTEPWRGRRYRSWLEL